MHEIYELKEMLCKELEEYGRKGEMSTGSLDIVDKLAHTVKNLCKIIEYAEMEEDGYSEADGGSYRQGQGGGGNNRYSRDGGNRSYSMDGRGGSYARGRGDNARRDSRGRYSRIGDGYSMADESMEDIVTELKEVAQGLPEVKRREVMRFVQKMEQM